MALYRIGSTWYYDFEFKGRRYKSSTRTTKKTLARSVEDTKRRELIEGKAPVIDVLFDDFAKTYLKTHAANKRGEKFYKYSIRVLGRTFNGKLLSEIGPADVDTFMAMRRAEVATATSNRSLAVLKHMLKCAVRWHNLDRSPAAESRLEKEPKHRERFLTADEAGELLAACTTWLRLVVLAALHTGGRRGELLALQWDDVDLDRRRATFRETKNGEPRTIALTETLTAALKDVRPKFNAAGPVLLNHGGGKIHPDGLTWSFRLAARKAGLQGFRFHDLRHSAASFLVQAGVPLNTVRDLLGHKSLMMTLRYAHLAPDHQAGAVATLDRVLQTPSGARPAGETPDQPIVASL